MLVLSRKEGEQIVIGEDIVLEVVQIRGDKVRIGVSAPNEVPVHRQEVREAIIREGREFRRSGGTHSGSTQLEKLAGQVGVPLERRD